MRHLILGSLLSLALVSPAAAQLRPVAGTTVRTTDTTANSLIVGAAPGATTGTGGIKAGQISVNGVGIVGTDGRIPAFSSTYFAAATVTEAQVVDSTLLARVADTETISGAWTFTNAAGPIITNTAPILKWIETGGTANEARWRMIADGDLHVFQACTDNEATCNNIWVVDRTGATLDSLTLGAAKTIFPVGSVTAPSIALTEASGAASNDTGFYYTAATLNVAVNGTKVSSFNQSLVSLDTSAAVTGVAATTALTVLGSSGTPVVLNRSTSDGTMIDLQRDAVSQGSISVSGATVSYNAFMGSHYTQLQAGQDAPEAGSVVVSTGRVIPTKPRALTRQGGADADDAPEKFVYVEPSTRRNQKGVYGVWFAPLGKTAADASWGDPDGEIFQVAGLGLSPGVWVTDTCGPIANGNLLATSPLEGLAERQCTIVGNGRNGYDGLVRDYTLGKALVDVDWTKVAPDADGIRKMLIPVILMAG